ncbi:hypothetical protein ATERTT37_006727 [Aspergillus terreus]
MHSFLGLVGLLAGVSVSSAAPSVQNITSDAYFYGQSPPVYPSPEGNGTGSWAAAYQKAKAFVAQLTSEEKVNLTAGVTSDTGCSGMMPAIPRLNFPGLCVSDAGDGLRGTDYVNSWPSGIHAGASWNKNLARQRAYHMGTEFHKKGVNVLLGPVVAPLGRVVEGGRNWEGFSNDPYLSGALVYETVEGLQSAGVGACTKHFIGYEQETNRNPETVDGVDIASVSSNIDDKAMHELYLWPFQDAVHAGSVSVMCSYQRINNSYACQNSKTLNGLLKTELGFQGYVMTDWYGQHGGIAAANAGLDMVMPYTELWGSNLTDAISNGTMEASRLDDMATRIIASWYQVNQNKDFPAPGIGMPADVNEPHQAVIAYVLAPLDAVQQQAYEDGTSVLWDVVSEDPDVDATTDACLVFINAYATEGYDRPGLVNKESDTLITNVAAKCNNTIVTIHNAGIRLVGDWINHENVTAVIFAHLPGQDTGKALVELLYGRANPSGRLPYTVAKRAEDYGSLLHPSQPEGKYGLFPQSDFSEGVFIDYRAFDKQAIEPQFEFGFGLSYTSFNYSGLAVKKVNRTTEPYPASAPVQEGGNPNLWDEILTVSAKVQNSGSMDGDEVAQLYLGIPNAPVRQLRGFEKVGIPAGQAVNVKFSLTRRDLSVWDTEAQQWKLQSGVYQVYVGRSSRDLPLKGQFSI